MLAKRTPGFTGADLANMLNEGALLAARRGQLKITQSDLEEALDRVLEAHARSKERAYASGEELMPTRVVIMQFPIGREVPTEEELADEPAQADPSG